MLLFSALKASLAPTVCVAFLRRLANIPHPLPKGVYFDSAALLTHVDANCYYRRTSNPSAPKPPDVKVVVEGPAYSHLDLNDIQDAILLVEGQSGQVTKSSPREARLSFETSSDVSSQRSLLSPEGSQIDENEKPDEPFKIILRDSTGILQPQSVLALVRMILQVRVNVASRVVNDEWSVDGEALLRAARTATRPPALQMSTFDQQLRNLPMNPSRLNVELVRVCKLSQQPNKRRKLKV